GNGRLGGEVTQVPAGQVPTGTSSTSLVESKKPPPVVSPPIAYNLFVPESYANPKSALPIVNAGPVLHTPGTEVMSKRHVVVMFASGTGSLGCRFLDSTELCAPATLSGPLASKPPTTYRY